MKSQGAKSGEEDGMGDHTHVLAGKILPLPLPVGEQPMLKICGNRPCSTMHA
jgi:hypothetical protein